MKELIKLDLSISRELIDNQKNELLKKVESGEINALQLNTIIAMYEKMFNGDVKKYNGLKHLIKSHALKEHNNFGEKLKTIGDCKIEQAETGVTYDFSNDSIWNEIKEQENRVANLRKEREKFLKSISQGKGYIVEVNEDTGEALKTYAPLRKSTTSLKFTFK